MLCNALLKRSLRVVSVLKHQNRTFCWQGKMDAKLCGTTFTGSKLQMLLSASQKVRVNGLRIQHVEAETFGDGQGFTSKILRIKMHWSRANSTSPEPPKSIIVKVIGSTGISDLFDMVDRAVIDESNYCLKKIHDVECAIYNLPELPALMNLPICYFHAPNTARDPGLIGLEDLSDVAVGMSVREIGVSITKIQLDQLIEALATLHAWSANTMVDWRSKIPPFKDHPFLRTIFEQFTGAFEKSKDAYPHAFRDIDEEKLRQYLNFDKFSKTFARDPRLVYNLPTVLVHGDVHALNTLWEKDATGKFGNRLVAMIDWQLAHQGCAMEDLARLAVLSLSIDNMRKYKDYITAHYVELYNTKIRKPEVRISLEDVRRAFSDFFAYTAVVWACGLIHFDSLTKMLRGASQEEQVAIRDRIAEYVIYNFSDARKVFEL